MRSVVLPAPDGPRIARTLPAFTSAVIPLSSSLGFVELAHRVRDIALVGLPSLVTMTVYLQSVNVRCGPAAASPFGFFAAEPPASESAAFAGCISVSAAGDAIRASASKEFPIVADLPDEMPNMLADFPLRHDGNVRTVQSGAHHSSRLAATFAA